MCACVCVYVSVCVCECVCVCVCMHVCVCAYMYPYCSYRSILAEDPTAVMQLVRYYLNKPLNHFTSHSTQQTKPLHKPHTPLIYTHTCAMRGWSQWGCPKLASNPGFPFWLSHMCLVSSQVLVQNEGSMCAMMWQAICAQELLSSSCVNIISQAVCNI